MSSSTNEMKLMSHSKEYFGKLALEWEYPMKMCKISEKILMANSFFYRHVYQVIFTSCI